MDPANARFVETIVNDDGSQRVRVAADPAATAAMRPAANGTVSGDLAGLLQANFNTLGGGQTLLLAVGPAAATATLTWDSSVAGSEDVQTLSQLRGRLEAAIRAADAGNPTFAAARVTLENSRLRILTGRGGAAYRPRRTDHHHRRNGGRAGLRRGQPGRLGPAI